MNHESAIQFGFESIKIGCVILGEMCSVILGNMLHKVVWLYENIFELIPKILIAILQNHLNELWITIQQDIWIVSPNSRNLVRPKFGRPKPQEACALPSIYFI